MVCIVSINISKFVLSRPQIFIPVVIPIRTDFHSYSIPADFRCRILIPSPRLILFLILFLQTFVPILFLQFLVPFLIPIDADIFIPILIPTQILWEPHQRIHQTAWSYRRTSMNQCNTCPTPLCAIRRHTSHVD